ncbi:MAG: DUF2339 domain-containing protein [Phycisphaera sp.]|nr:DUF2339 domain-containing protein [Phycisphaera sp.]
MAIIYIILLAAAFVILVLPIVAMSKASRAEQLADKADRRVVSVLKRLDAMDDRVDALERYGLPPKSAPAAPPVRETPAAPAARHTAATPTAHPTVPAAHPTGPAAHPTTPAARPTPPAAPPKPTPVDQPLDLSADNPALAPHLRDNAAARTPSPADQIKAQPPVVKPTPVPPLEKPITTAAPQQDKSAPAHVTPIFGETSQAARVETPVAPTSGHAPAAPAAPAGPRPPRAVARAADDAKWEERLGTKLAVWVGAVALALAGLYFVRYMVQHGVLTAERRVLLSGMFGLTLFGVGEFFHKPMHRIGAGLTAAGSAVLFGAVLASANLYHFIEPITAFALLIALTGITVALSLRHGPFVAILGLAAGFLTPALIGANNVTTVQLFGYLFLLEAGLLALTRQRNWWWMGLATMAGGFGWAVIWLLFFHANHPDGSVWVGLFLLMSIATFVIGSFASEQQIGAHTVGTVVPWLGVVVGMALVAWLLGAGTMTTLEWAYMGVLGAGCLVLGRLRERFFGLSGLAAVLGVVMLGVWYVNGLTTGDTTRFALTALCFGVLYGGGAYAALWGVKRPVPWAALSVLSAIAYAGMTYWVIDEASVIAPWWVISVGLAGLLCGLSVPVLARRDSIPDGDTVLAILLSGVSGFVAVAVPLFVNHYDGIGPQWMTIAWALQLVAVAAIAWQLRAPLLHHVVAILGALVAARLLFNPWVLTYDIGDLPVLNWLAYGYGLPLGCFAATAWILRRDGAGNAPKLAPLFDLGAMSLGFVMVTLMVRHGFHRDLTQSGLTMYEMSTYSVAWAFGASMLLISVQQWPLTLVRRGGVVIAALSIIATLFGVGLVVNPMWNADAAGAVGNTILFNGLLYAIALPTLLAAQAAWLPRRANAANIADVFDIGVLALVMLALALFVRQGFHTESMLLRGGVTLYELTTYGVMWLMLGSSIMELVPRTKLNAMAAYAKVVVVIALLALLVGTGLIANPLWNVHAAESLGGMPLFNGLLYVLIVPTALVGVLSWQARRNGVNDLATLLDRVCIGYVFIATLMLIRHGFHVDDMRLVQQFTIVETATYSIVWLTGAVGMLLAAKFFTKMPMLRIGGRALTYVGLAAVLFGGLSIYNPLFSQQDVGTWVLFNWLLYIFGVPAALTMTASYLARQIEETSLADVGETCTLILGVVLASMLVRQGFHTDDMQLDRGFSLAEFATYAVIWLGASVGMLLAATRWTATILPAGGYTLTFMGLGAVALGTLVAYNPAFSHQAVPGVVIFNALLYYYGVPAACVLIAGRLYHRLGHGDLAAFCGVTTLVLAFVLVTLQVRQAFHGLYLDGDMPANAEWYAYSAAWIVFAVTLLVLGIATQSKTIRYASLAVMVIAIGKVFLFDTRHLEDLYRVMSFLGLGLSLFGLAYVYQRFVFRSSLAGVPPKSDHDSL